MSSPASGYGCPCVKWLAQVKSAQTSNVTERKCGGLLMWELRDVRCLNWEVLSILGLMGFALFMPGSNLPMFLGIEGWAGITVGG
jgi:hypothetical protein